MIQARIRRRYSASTRFLLGALAALAGCASDDQGATRSAPTAAENQINPRPRAELREGGTLTIPLGGMPPNFNYGQLDGTLQDNAWVIGALMPLTFSTDASGTPVWSRDYLASEPVLETEPKQRVTYRIHPRAVWYDDTPITWEDFHWQWKANNGTDARYRISSSNGYEEVESVNRGADDREVVVTFKRPFADWQSIFYFIYPATTTRDPRIFNEGWTQQPLTTAGPFKFAALNQTTKTITLVRNEKWWGEPALLDTIVFRVIEADAQIDALANGEIDAMDVGPDVNKYNRARGIAGVELRTAGGPNFRHMTINGTSQVLTDVNVRRALAMAIDRDAIARAMIGPLGVETAALNNHIFMRNQGGYRDNAHEIGRYDPEAARRMLDSAGWKLEGSVRRKGGQPLQLNFVIPSAVATSRQESELVQNMLAQVGATVQINTVPANDFFDKYVTPGQFDFTVFSWMGTAYPVSSAKSIYAKPVQRPDGSLDVKQNYARVGSDEIDRLFNAANAELDRQKAIELANRADSLVWQSVHSLTLYQRPEIAATRATLANFGAFGFAQPWRYQDIGWVR